MSHDAVRQLNVPFGTQCPATGPALAALHLCTSLLFRDTLHWTQVVGREQDKTSPKQPEAVRREPAGHPTLRAQDF